MDRVMRYDELMFMHFLAKAEKVVVRKGTPNPNTREGQYYDLTVGLCYKSFFVGYNLEDNKKLIIEVVG